jgi:hypothetical protein
MHPAPTLDLGDPIDPVVISPDHIIAAKRDPNLGGMTCLTVHLLGGAQLHIRYAKPEHADAPWRALVSAIANHSHQ